MILATELNFCIDAANVAEGERNSAISRIVNLEKELDFAKLSTKELEGLKRRFKELEDAGKTHDEEMESLLNPVAEGLSGK